MQLVNRAGVNWKEISLKHTETWEHTSWPSSCSSETLWAHRIAAVRSQSNSGRAYENVGPQDPKTSHFTDSSTYNMIPWTVFGSLQNSYWLEYRTPPAPARFQDMKAFWHNSTNAARWNEWKHVNVYVVHTHSLAVLLWATADLKWYAWKYPKIDGP